MNSKKQMDIYNVLDKVNTPNYSKNQSLNKDDKLNKTP
jgi:hypothetical protein